MPFTPYHFGPSGFIGLVFRRWIDTPVFVLANVIVDVEVLVVMLFGLGPPHHRYCHTLLFGAAAGALWGLAAYLLRPLFEEIMEMLHISYKPGLRKMVISGILGVWLHVLIDGAYHPDVRVFWPSETESLWITVMSHVSREQIKTICLVFFVAAIIPYGIAVASYMRRNKTNRNRP
jgi:membrane-bound metal-dependent hydrolase YbcI (DUF457 family)